MKPSWPLLSSIGFEVVATVAGAALVGYWIDRHTKSAPWGLLIGSVLGLLAGLYNLVREGLRANRGSDAGSSGAAGGERRKPPEGPANGRER
jgi:F0F1-type ATP synthase assembly protein I